MDKDIVVAKMLVKRKLITEQQLKGALEQKKSTGQNLVDIFDKDNIVPDNILLAVYADVLHIPYVDLNFYPVNYDYAQEVPETIARRFKALPISKAGSKYIVAMSQPEDIIAIEQIEKKLKTNIIIVLVKEEDLLEAIDNTFRQTEELSSLVGEVGEGLSDDSSGDEEFTYDSDAPIIHLLNSIFEDAARSDTSDIHIEPGKDNFKIRQRKDGVLHEQIMKDKSALSALVSRLKLMAKLNISEKRLPQDGSFQIKTQKGGYTIRISTLPVRYGESVVMRLLQQDGSLTTLDKIEMPVKVREALIRNIYQPNGVILVTGPTGSGKSTLLYALLNELNSPENKIVTAEDPVEYTLPGLNQVHVQPKIGLTFANVLRSVLRQDPDIIMVGEIRDLETAEISLQAAMTGHLVFSTVHTNDAITTPERLIDLGLEPYLVSSSLRLVIAQRLMRKVCEVCAEEYIPNKDQKAWLEASFAKEKIPEKFYVGRGCTSCHKSGYKGRLAIFELLEFNDDRLDLLRKNQIAELKLQIMGSDDFKSLGQSALEMAGERKTSLQEVFKIVGGME